MRFVFAHGVGLTLARRLKRMSIIVEGYRLADDVFQTDYEKPVLLSETSNEDVNVINKVNLDVSTMLAYTSSLTNGSCGKYKFSVPVLAQAAEWECLRPVKPVLHTLFEGNRILHYFLKVE